MERAGNRHVLATLACALAFARSAQSVFSSDAGDKAAPGRDWDLVRSVENPFGGTNDLVLIPDHRKRDNGYYQDVANAVCGERTSCMVNFWTDRAHIPKSGDMPVEDLAVMTAEYERYPTYKEPVLNLACWLYPSKEIAERAKCAYMPGADIPWKK
jgi:hypothetical protein